MNTKDQIGPLSLQTIYVFNTIYRLRKMAFETFRRKLLSGNEISISASSAAYKYEIILVKKKTY